MQNRNVSLSEEVFALCPLFPKATGASFNIIHVTFYDESLPKFVNVDDSHIIYCKRVSDVLVAIKQLVCLYRDELLDDPDMHLKKLEKYVENKSQDSSKRTRGVRPA